MLSAQNISRPRPGSKPHVSPEGIIYCMDGKFRWVYEIDQRKHPSVLFSLLWKCLAAGVLVGVLPLILGAFQPFGSLLFLLGSLVVGALLALAGYAGHILRSGPMMCLLFTADEQGVSCQQVKGKNTKQTVSHAIAAWVGGQSQPALRFYDAMQVQYDAVSSIRARSARDLIQIGGLAVRTEPEQFPLVLDYFKRQCPHAAVEEA